MCCAFGAGTRPTESPLQMRFPVRPPPYRFSNEQPDSGLSKSFGSKDLLTRTRMLDCTVKAKFKTRHPGLFNAANTVRKQDMSAV